MQLRPLVFLIVCSFWSCSANNESEQNLLYTLISRIEAEDSTQIQSTWNQIQGGNQPFIWDDSTAFIYKGKASSVLWNGDFNGWGQDTTFDNKGQRITNSDFWILKTAFPPDARFDYKIVVDGNWIIDPANAAIQMTGAGGGQPNSEIRMPESYPSVWTEDKARNRGHLTDWIKFESNSLGYDLNYKVYTPYNYSQIDSLPTIYCTDGHEYSHPQLGGMIEVLDNLNEQGKIEPVIVVFIDPREPANPQNNRRMSELSLNTKYVEFISHELVPGIDSTYKTIKNRAYRTIMGTSMGGLNASYLGVKSPDVFGSLLIQSPAYRYKPDIYNLVQKSEPWPDKISISTGVFNDTQPDALKMKALYLNHLDTIQYIEVNEGHSWGNWRALLDDQLIYILGK